MGINKYLIAGASVPENWFYNDIWQFSFENVVWSSNSLELPGITWTRMKEAEVSQICKFIGKSGILTYEGSLCI